MRDCINQEKNQRRCPAKKNETPYHSICCLCIRHFLAKNDEPPCVKQKIKELGLEG